MQTTAKLRSVAASTSLIGGRVFAAYTHARRRRRMRRRRRSWPRCARRSAASRRSPRMKGLSLRADYRREMGRRAAAAATMMIMAAAGPAADAADAAQMTGKIEIDVELPERYLRADIGSSRLRDDAHGRLRRRRGRSSKSSPNNPGMTRPDRQPGRPIPRARRRCSSAATRARAADARRGRHDAAGLPRHLHLRRSAESPDGKARHDRRQRT